MQLYSTVYYVQYTVQVLSTADDALHVLCTCMWARVWHVTMGVVVWAEPVDIGSPLYQVVFWGKLAVDYRSFIVYAMDINGVSSGGSMPRLRDVMRR